MPVPSVVPDLVGQTKTIPYHYCKAKGVQEVTQYKIDSFSHTVYLKEYNFGLFILSKSIFHTRFYFAEYNMIISGFNKLFIISYNIKAESTGMCLLILFG